MHLRRCRSCRVSLAKLSGFQFSAEEFLTPNKRVVAFVAGDDTLLRAVSKSSLSLSLLTFSLSFRIFLYSLCLLLSTLAILSICRLLSVI